jgi:hypothetical protein
MRFEQPAELLIDFKTETITRLVSSLWPRRRVRPHQKAKPWSIL